MDYLEVADVIDKPGLRLILTRGMPGPWGLAARALFDVKGVAYLATAQYPGGDNSALLEATGQDSAPVALYNQERPRAKWEELLVLADSLAPEPRLIPEDIETRALMFGLIREITGENGLGWLRRIMIFQPALESANPAELFQALGHKYGYSPLAAKGAASACMTILSGLAARLEAQKAAGSDYFIGQQLCALDIYWAVFSSMVQPLPQDVNPMPPGIRELYLLPQPLLDQLDPILIEHRDLIYQRHLSLPLDY